MKVKDEVVKECPYCGHKRFGEGFQKGPASVGTSWLGNGQRLFHVICLNCGSVVRSYVEYPEKFR